MARTEAYGDYCERLKEPFELLRVASATMDQRLASAASKGAVVLAAAALERYLNDAVSHICRGITVEEWEALAPGFQSYLAQQFARRLVRATDAVLETSPVSDKNIDRLRRAIDTCATAFDTPATWEHLPQFGLFESGDSAPDRIGKALSRFSVDNGDPLAALDQRPRGRDAVMRDLGQLVEARHAAAHALPDRADPGPNDAQGWIVSSFLLVRQLERFIAVEIDVGHVPDANVA